MRNSWQAITSAVVFIVLAAIVAVTSSDAAAGPETGCLERAAAWAEVNPTLLRAIAWVESRGDPGAVNWNRNGTYDVGLMQVNSWWYDRGLATWWRGLGHPCVNVAAGAWILRQCTAEYGYTWEAVGCYHVGSGWTKGSKRQAAEAYIRRVQAALGIGPGQARSR